MKQSHGLKALSRARNSSLVETINVPSSNPGSTNILIDISELLQGQHPGHQELRQGGLNRRHRQQSHRLNFRRPERPLDTSFQIPMANIMIFLADDSLGNYFFNWPIKHFKKQKIIRLIMTCFGR